MEGQVAVGKRLPTVWFRLAVVLPAVVFQVLFFSWTVDDAYISLRYAENLADGLGLVFNVGERVEGFSNPLWVVLIAGLIRVGVPAVLASKALGVAAFYLVLYYCELLLRSTIFTRVDSERCFLWTSALVISSGTLLFYSISGMETVAFSLWVLAALCHTFRALHVAGAASELRYAGCYCGLAALTRPEGLLLALVVAFYVVVTSRRIGGNRQLSALTALLLPTLVFFTGYLFFRFFYFDSLLPNTYYAKSFGTVQLLHTGVVSGAGLTSALTLGWKYTLGFLVFRGGGVALICLLIVGRTGQFGYSVVGAVRLLLLFAVCYTILFIIPVGGDWMILHRFFAPVIPPLFLGAILALASRWDRPKGVRAPVVLGGVACLLLAVATGYQMRHYEISSNRVTTQETVGKWLRDHIPPGATIVVNEVGAIPFYSGLRTIDTSGLTDKAIAQAWFQPGDKTTRWLRAILDRRPEYILIPARIPLTPEIPGSIEALRTSQVFDEEIFQRLYLLPDFQREYHYLRDFADLGDARTLFRRRDLP